MIVILFFCGGGEVVGRLGECLGGCDGRDVVECFRNCVGGCCGLRFTLRNRSTSSRFQELFGICILEQLDPPPVSYRGLTPPFCRTAA